MYTLCNTEKTALQQRLFEQTFLQMLLEDDYDNITISDLCRKAGLSRKIFYRLFDKKADILYSLIDNTLLEASSYIPDDSVGPGELHRFFAFWQSQKDLLDMLAKHQKSHMLTDRAIGMETILFYVSGIFSLVLVWHQSDYLHSIDEMSNLLMDLLSTAAIKHPLPQ